MISRNIIPPLAILCLLATLPLPAAADWPGGFLWPQKAREDIRKARETAAARLQALETKRDTYAGHRGQDDPMKAKYLEYDQRAKRYERIVEGYDALRSNTTSNYYLRILSDTLCWTAQDLTAIASDMLNRWPDLVAGMIEDGWMSAISQAYDSMFRTLIRNKIRDRLGYDLCTGLERDLFAIVMPREKRAALSTELAGDEALSRARNAFAVAAASRSAESLGGELKHISPSAAKGMTNARAKDLVGRVVSRAAAAVDVVSFVGDIAQKTYFYTEFSTSVDREIGALATLKARCQQAGTALGCEDLMKVRSGELTCAGVPPASGPKPAPVGKPAALHPIERMGLAQGFDPKYCDFDALKKDPSFPALQAAMSAAYERAGAGRRPTDAQLLAINKTHLDIHRRVMNAEGVFALSDEKWAGALNATNSIAMAVESWSGLPR